MWSTANPPDVLEITKPIDDIEKTFDFRISEIEALELYDMEVDRAAQRIDEMMCSGPPDTV